MYLPIETLTKSHALIAAEAGELAARTREPITVVLTPSGADLYSGRVDVKNARCFVVEPPLAVA